MLSFYTLDVSVQEKITRFSIEYFLQELAEQLGSPDQWEMAAADSAIVAYQRGEFDHALRCISVGEKPAHQRPFLEPLLEAISSFLDSPNRSSSVSTTS